MSVRIARRGAIAASRAAGTPTSYTLNSLSSDGYMSGTPSAADGNGTAVFTGDLYVGQASGPLAYETFMAFDTSAVAGAITAVTLSLYGVNDSSTTDFTVEVRPYNFGATLTTADWRSPGTLASLPLVASKATAGGWNTSGYNALTSEAAFLSNITQGGTSYFVVSSSRHRNGDAPSGNEYVGFKSIDTGSTPQGPKLVIEALV